MATLNEILQLTNLVTQKLLENSGLITPEISKLLDITEQGLPSKVDAYSAVLDRIEMDAGYFNEKAKEYRNASSQLSDAAVRLKARMKEAMITNGLLEIKGNDERFVLSPGKSAVEVVDQTIIPAKFKSEKITVETVIDKDALRAELEKGALVKGVELRPVFSLRRYINKAK
jgi:hypothetical protein